MQRQAASQQTLAGFDVIDFDAAFPETSGQYATPRYNELASTRPADAGRPLLSETHPLQESAVLVLLGLIRAGHSLSVAASWGKDSANCVLLMIEAVRRAVAEGISTLHFITTSSTGTEMPLMEMHAIRCHLRHLCRNGRRRPSTGRPTGNSSQRTQCESDPSFRVHGLEHDAFTTSAILSGACNRPLPSGAAFFFGAERGTAVSRHV